MEDNCVGIAAGVSTSQETSAQNRGKECKKCGEPNHFATVCGDKKLNQIGAQEKHREPRERWTKEEI